MLACGGPTCLVPVFHDADGDGVGSEPAGFACEPTEGLAFVDGDCDDDEASVYPGAVEQCDLVDQDCDGVADEGFDLVPWFPDLDADGFGDAASPVQACRIPVAGYLREGGDCDDEDREVHPFAPEVCDGIDNNCDGDVDDDDPDLVEASRTTSYADEDGDGYGDPSIAVDRCEPPEGYVDNDLDCLDSDPTVNPDARLELCDGVDNDCDGLLDIWDTEDRSANPVTVDEASLTELPCDLDADGFGDPVSTCLTCVPTVGVAVDNALDCDDYDALATVAQPWYVDLDGDGAGAGAEQAYQCSNPNPTGDDPLAPGTAGIDCAPNDPSIFPGAADPVGDGIDSDCSGRDG